MALASLTWSLPPHSAHGLESPFQLRSRHSTLPWENLEVWRCFFAQIIAWTSWINVAPGWWPWICLMVTRLSSQPETAAKGALHMSSLFLCWRLGIHDKYVWVFYISTPHSHFEFFEWSGFENPCDWICFSIQLSCSNCASLRSVWVPI